MNAHLPSSRSYAVVINNLWEPMNNAFHGRFRQWSTKNHQHTKNMRGVVNTIIRHYSELPDDDSTITVLAQRLRNEAAAAQIVAAEVRAAEAEAIKAFNQANLEQENGMDILPGDGKVGMPSMPDAMKRECKRYMHAVSFLAPNPSSDPQNVLLQDDDNDEDYNNRNDEEFDFGINAEVEQEPDVAAKVVVIDPPAACGGGFELAEAVRGGNDGAAAHAAGRGGGGGQAANVGHGQGGGRGQGHGQGHGRGANEGCGAGRGGRGAAATANGGGAAAGCGANAGRGAAGGRGRGAAGSNNNNRALAAVIAGGNAVYVEDADGRDICRVRVRDNVKVIDAMHQGVSGFFANLSNLSERIGNDCISNSQRELNSNLKSLYKCLRFASDDGDEEKVARLTAQINRLEDVAEMQLNQLYPNPN
jgi:hypothetical protein